MKLLKLEIGDLPKEKQFRSLHAGFKVEFHSLDTKGIKAMESFSPFCFAGLNGSGKSNVLEALAAIFYHLECCVAKFRPQSFEKHFRPEECSPDAFTLEYLIGQQSSSQAYVLAHFDKITVTKKEGESPQMTRQSYPFKGTEDIFPVSLIPKDDLREPQAAPGKLYLPDIVVGYSSGENEILSLPFRKSRLINFDKYGQDSTRKYRFEEPENSLIYIDSEMSQAVLLVCLLYEDEQTLSPLKRELGIFGIKSFRMNINDHFKEHDSFHRTHSLDHIKEQIDNLKRISTSWFESTRSEKYDATGMQKYVYSNLVLDFYIDSTTKRAFRDYFKSSFELFRFLQVLYELNAISVEDYIKEEVYKSKGFYTDWKIPKGSPSENVFFFEDYYIMKRIDGESEAKELLLREFSDGEHQFLHTMGICLMLKIKRCVLLLDEPETHFNPSWRAKFIKILNDSIEAAAKSTGLDIISVIHLLKDILLTSHSPFIISDCMPNNVIFFDRNEKTKKLQARKASELSFNTYGTSVEIILDELFNYNQSIGDKSNEDLQKIDFEFIRNKNEALAAKELLHHLGHSIEKDIVLAKLNQIIRNENGDEESESGDFVFIDGPVSPFVGNSGDLDFEDKETEGRETEELVPA